MGTHEAVSANINDIVSAARYLTLAQQAVTGWEAWMDPYGVVCKVTQELVSGRVRLHQSMVYTQGGSWIVGSEFCLVNKDNPATSLDWIPTTRGSNPEHALGNADTDKRGAFEVVDVAALQRWPTDKVARMAENARAILALATTD